MGEKQKLTGTLTDMEIKGNLTRLTFLVNKEEVKISAFSPPDLPNLKMNEDYAFSAEEYRGYLNLSPIWKNKEKVGHDIHLAGEDEYYEPVKSHVAKIEAIKPVNGEAKRQTAIIRESCLSSAALIVAHAGHGSTNLDIALDSTLIMAKRFEKWVLEP